MMPAAVATRHAAQLVQSRSFVSFDWSSRIFARGAAAKAREESVDVPGAFPPRGPLRVRTKPKDLSQLKVGFIGWGAMAQAVSLGIIREDLTESSSVMATDVVPEILEAAAREGLQTTASNQTLVEWADLVVMAVKPQVVDAVIKDIAPVWKDNKVLVSICAGVTIDTFQDGLGDGSKVVRVMPNTPCLVSEAATAYAASKRCADWEVDLVYDMFAAVGNATHRVPESLLNSVTGLSGSGPAYVYMLIQALSDAGVQGGLPRKVALSLATQTVIGSAKMVQETGTHPEVLKEAVTSPGGTTIAGVRALERAGFRSAVIEAVEAARLRAEGLSGK
eukprot:CAMPEP_0176057782 /NCGR_PEP_ID=MMETSP0120_2-20121206/28781_1 /TAXON_ID=160619 /ORGANISM="Kryptoperidinium foliaceum, Strain CCMP 1326" /LENGTH=333 /DNA_ID=CAMNT_0017391295 /DNA_START=50 /DNA_END=1051 /DNA_ORIENTATION=-